MKYFILLVLFITSLSTLLAQDELSQKEAELAELQQKELKLRKEIESLKLDQSKNLLKKAGYPVSPKSLELIEHSGMTIGFDCDYKMAAWVYHVLSPEVATGNVSRTNDFREDESTSCGSAMEADYFLKTKRSDGGYDYDGFGFDRGHLAPSADFRWSETALSESYYYSNMTPQRPEFNRESWADLEGLLRTITIQENKSLYVITGPVLNESLPIVERSVNQLRIPEFHYKIVVDLSEDQPKGMAFLLPNKKCEKRPSEYVITIDSLESITGLDFFSGLNPELETTIESFADYSKWKAQRNTIDVEPISPFDLPKGHFNTTQAASKEGRKVSIVGKVVSTKYIPKSQSTFLNLDQSFPNQVFSVMIWKEGRRNFSYKPEEELEGKYIVVTGVVSIDRNGVPGITVDKEEQIELYDEIK